MRTAAALLLIAGALLAPAVPVSADPPETPRVVAADYNKVAGPRSQMYRKCVGAGRAEEGLRADWQEHLKMCQDDIGFRSMRFHGIFTDEMGVYSEDKAGNPIYNWQYVDTLYDALLKSGIRPFVEIGFTPRALATQDAKVFWWQANPSPPKDWNRWQALVTAFVTHLTERYGRDEIARWNFEVWNEPDLNAFLRLPKEVDRKAAYFDLYEKTARAIKKVDTAYRVGGPSTAGPKAWITDLIAYCDKTATPIDFITFHVYGLAGQDGGFDEGGGKRYFIHARPLDLAGAVAAGNRLVTRSSRPDLPVYVTEWNTSYAKLDPVLDSYYSAAHNLGQIKETEKLPHLGAMSRWVFTDIFEEDGVPPTPFYGGFGLINLQGIKKPAFFAYKFLSALGDQELVNPDKSSWVCRDDKGGVQALLFDLTYPMKEQLKQSNREFFGQVHPSFPRTPLTLRLAGMRPGNYQITVYRVGFQKNDAFTAYQEMGSPKSLTRDQVTKLKAVASGAPESVETISIPADGHFTRTFPLRSNDIYLIALAKK